MRKCEACGGELGGAAHVCAERDAQLRALHARAVSQAERSVEGLELEAELSGPDMERVTAALAWAFEVGWHARGDAPVRALVDPMPGRRAAKAAPAAVEPAPARTMPRGVGRRGRS